MAATLSKKTRISLKETLNKIIPDVPDENLLQVLVACFIGFITLVILWRLLRRGSKRGAILLMGLCESGKTQLFSQLCHGKDVISVTSFKETSGQYSSGKKRITVYDLPGHERLRYAVFEKVKTQARGILFMVDSSTIQKDVRDVAEFLYTVLCDGSVLGGVSRLLIVCNKQDLPLAKAVSLIQLALEKEMTMLRVTRANQLQLVGGAANNNNFLGYQGRDFEFSHLPSIKIDFAEATTKGGEQLDEIKSWLNQLA